MLSDRPAATGYQEIPAREVDDVDPRLLRSGGQGGETMGARDTMFDEEAPTPAFEYRQVWQPEKGVISAYLCSPRASGPQFGDMYARDWACLRRVSVDLKTYAASGRRILTVLPLHFENIGRTACRHELLQALSGLPPQRKRLIVIEIDGIPDGVPATRLMYLITAMRAHCRSVLLQFGLDAAVKDLVGCGALGAGVDLRRYEGCEADTFQRLQRFSAAAQKSKLHLYATGLESRSLVAAVLALKFRYLEGGAVAPPLNHLSGIEGFNLLDLYNSST
jgi:hypothetical protein